MAVATKRKKDVAQTFPQRVLDAMEELVGLKMIEVDVEHFRQTSEESIMTKFYDEVLSKYKRGTTFPDHILDLYDKVADRLDEIDEEKRKAAAIQKQAEQAAYGDDIVLPKGGGDDAAAGEIVVEKKPAKKGTAKAQKPVKVEKLPDPSSVNVSEGEMKARTQQMLAQLANEDAAKKEEPTAASLSGKKKGKFVMSPAKAAKKKVVKKNDAKKPAKAKPEKKAVPAPVAANGAKGKKKKSGVVSSNKRGTVPNAANVARPARTPKEKDSFGFRVGTTISNAVALMNGNMTLAQIAQELDLQQNLYYVVNRLRGAGHKVTFSDSLVTAIAAKRKKVV